MLPRLRDWERSLSSFLGSSGASVERLVVSAAGAVAAAVAALTSSDFFGSLDLERVAADAMTAGLAGAVLAVDHGGTE